MPQSDCPLKTGFTVTPKCQVGDHQFSDPDEDDDNDEDNDEDDDDEDDEDEDNEEDIQVAEKDSTDNVQMVESTDNVQMVEVEVLTDPVMETTL